MANSNDQAVIVFWKLSDDTFGEYDEREKIFALEDRLIDVVERKELGECDGHEFGEGWATLYVYGRDADALALSVTAILREFQPTPGSHLIQRAGPPGTAERKIML